MYLKKIVMDCRFKTFVEGLIENDMLNFYFVSLISSENEDKKEVWEENLNQLNMIEDVINEIDINDKAKWLERINDARIIINKELEKYVL